MKNVIKTTPKEEQKLYLNNFKIQPKIINLCAEEIFEEFNRKGGYRLNIDKENSSKFNKNEEKKIKEKKENKNNKFNDLFLDFAMNSIKRKIELRNQYNQELTIQYIKELIKNEIEKIKFILALYYYNLNNPNRNISIDLEGKDSSYLLKDTNHKNLLDKSFNKYFRLNDYYKSLLNNDNRNRNDVLYTKKKNFCNTIDKSKFNNISYNINYYYVYKLMDQLSNNNEKKKIMKLILIIIILEVIQI